METGPPQQQGAPVSKAFYGLMIFVGIVALAMIVVGLATPAWLVLDYSVIISLLDLQVYMGLWVVRFCFNGYCETKSIDEFWDQLFGGFSGASTTVPHAMIEYRVETTLSAVLMIIVLICLFKLMCCSPHGIYQNSKGWWIIPCISAPISAILALTAAGKYGSDVRTAHNLLSSFGISPYKVPYSIIIEGIGGLCAGLLFILLVIETIRAFGRINSMQSQQGYVMSTYPPGVQQPYGLQQPYAQQPYGHQQPYVQQPYMQQPYGPGAQGGFDYNAPPPGSYAPSSKSHGSRNSRNSSKEKHYPPADYGRRY